jgi:hypothetical protein
MARQNRKDKRKITLSDEIYNAFKVMLAEVSDFTGIDHNLDIRYQWTLRHILDGDLFGIRGLPYQENGKLFFFINPYNRQRIVCGERCANYILDKTNKYMEYTPEICQQRKNKTLEIYQITIKRILEIIAKKDPSAARLMGDMIIV